MYSCLRGENISWKGISYAVKLLFIGKDNRHTISYMDSESRLFINPLKRKKKSKVYFSFLKIINVRIHDYGYV